MGKVKPTVTLPEARPHAKEYRYEEGRPTTVNGVSRAVAHSYEYGVVQEGT